MPGQGERVRLKGREQYGEVTFSARSSRSVV